MQDISKFLSAKDIFNYYIGGTFWLVSLLLLVPAKLDSLLFQNTLPDFFTTTVFVVLGITVPYVLGFLLNPLCAGTTKVIEWVVGDPVKWATDKDAKNWLSLLGFERLGASKVERVKKLFLEIFKIEKGAKFYLIRDYVAYRGGVLQEYINRSHDLMSFSESLILPVPLAIFTILETYFFLTWQPAFLIAAIAFLLLAWRYIRFRAHWVKRVYRTFLVIDNKQGTEES